MSVAVCLYKPRCADFEVAPYSDFLLAILAPANLGSHRGTEIEAGSTQMYQ